VRQEGQALGGEEGKAAMSKTHKHQWVKANVTWTCTKKVRGGLCERPAIVRCADHSCEENDDLTGRCAKHAPRARKAKPFERWLAPTDWQVLYRNDKDFAEIHVLCGLGGTQAFANLLNKHRVRP
jgi:hypothetical protein